MDALESKEVEMNKVEKEIRSMAALYNAKKNDATLAESIISATCTWSDFFDSIDEPLGVLKGALGVKLKLKRK